MFGLSFNHASASCSKTSPAWGRARERACLGFPEEIHPARTYRLHQEVAHFLLLVPVLHAVVDLLQELLVVLQQLGDLIEDLVHQRWVTQQRVLWLLQWLHVTLWGSKGLGVPIDFFSHPLNTNLSTPANMAIGGTLQQGVPPVNVGLWDPSEGADSTESQNVSHPSPPGSYPTQCIPMAEWGPGQVCTRNPQSTASSVPQPWP